MGVAIATVVVDRRRLTLVEERLTIALDNVHCHSSLVEVPARMRHGTHEFLQPVSFDSTVSCSSYASRQ